MGNPRERVGVHHDRDGGQVLIGQSKAAACGLVVLLQEVMKNIVHQEYFYVRSEDVFGHELVLRKEECRHLVRSLRKKIGDSVFAVDGNGKRYKVRIRKMGRSEVVAEILRTEEMAGESRIELTLAQGMIKGSRLDWLVEKATELGVKRIVPVRTKHSNVQSLSANRMSRLRKIALSAMKQSGRSVLPAIEPVQTLDRLLEGASGHDLRLLAHPDSENLPSRPKRIPEIKILRVLCLVGPEGGLENVEIQKAMDCDFQPISLGARRLRSETAGLALVVWVLSQFDGWHPRLTVPASDCR